MPTDWPLEFSAEIQTNLTWRLTGEGGHPVRGKMFYKWSSRALRVDHGAGNFECEHFYHTAHPCSLIHLPSGTYRLLKAPPAGEPECCLDLPQIAAPPPDWATRGSPSDAGTTMLPYTYGQGEGFQYLDTGNCTDRLAGDNSGCHSYYEKLPGAAPLLFTFPANGGLQDWYWLPHTRVVNASLPDSLFTLPIGCMNKTCPKSSDGARRGASALPMAVVALGALGGRT